MSRILDIFSRGFARLRSFNNKRIRFLRGRPVDTPTFEISIQLFVRMLGVVFAVAFISLWVQIEGLIGAGGILPAEEFLDAVERQVGIERYLLLPTWGWLGASNTFLNLFCAAGTTISILLIFGVAPAWCLLALWSLYLSMAGLCQVFLSFQWDVLLLEVGFLAIFLWPGHRFKRKPTGHRFSQVGRLLLVYLLARLMLQSGMVKLASGDLTWWSLSALDYHYWTQPLPTWIGLWAHGLPSYVDRMSLVVMFAVELVLPFLVFASRRLRATAAIGFILFQCLIAITGNYGFFNLLTVVLCLLLVDDGMWPGAVRRRLCRDAPEKLIAAPRGRWAKVGYGLAMVYVAITLIQTVSMLGWRSPEQWIQPLTRTLSPFRSINRYGLFASMTTRRPEIIIEGSSDGDVWQAYEFVYKPGTQTRAPAIIPGHMPRLDWQLWFAALGDYRSHPWFMRVLESLLEGKKDVLDLLEHNPFPDAPPRFIRAVLYDYTPASVGRRRETGVWWTREVRGLYCPVLEVP